MLFATLDPTARRLTLPSGLTVVAVDTVGFVSRLPHGLVEAMRQEGLTKEMVGRDGFLERAWAWKTKFGNRIVSQLKKLGTSCDWQRERFTMDEGCSKAVEEVFVRLYEKGWIYKGSRIINWCPKCQTSLSDAEVEHVDQDGRRQLLLDIHFQ